MYLQKFPRAKRQLSRSLPKKPLNEWRATVITAGAHTANEKSTFQTAVV
jgi:hypothetical protein